jgi:hypothetical protein
VSHSRFQRFLVTFRRILLLVLLLVIASSLAACGGSDSTDTGASELAHQHELAEARRQGAQDARQATRIEALERELHAVKRHEQSGEHDTAGNQATTPEGHPEEEQLATETGPDDWPGGSGFTAILASLSSEAEATAVEAEATHRGLDAGILYSSDYSSLRPGYWVVFSGVFPNDDGAEARASHAHELGYPDAYPRFVAP